MCDKAQTAAQSLSAAMVRRMFLSGACNLENQKETINELNVFPVPDGDTGTNMCLTVMSASEAIEALDEITIDKTFKAISSGSLRGARGNSGVILSQLFRGFSKVARDYDELNIEVITHSMERAVETAYKAVMKPKEGTILTVARGMSERASAVWKEAEDLNTFFDEILDAGRAALLSTPDLLPVLKEAGVVDSGGQGLLAVIEGAVDAYRGRDHQKAEKAEEEEVRILYRTEVVYVPNKNHPNEETRLRKEIAGKAENLSISCTDQGFRILCTAEDPGAVLSLLSVSGMMDDIRIRQISKEERSAGFEADGALQMTSDTDGLSHGPDGQESVPGPVPEARCERAENAFIAVSCGDGIASIFRDLGVDYVLEGGQTMNPSTEDILAAIRYVNADVVYVLPNNKNIILAANQAASLTKDCQVVVIPTKTIPQGITAVVSFLPEIDPEENCRAMTEEIARVRTGEVTYAVRDTKIDGKEIHIGDIMGIGDAGLLSVGGNIEEVILSMLDQITDEESELISLYAGADLPEDEAEKIRSSVSARYPQVDVELNRGGQPVYYCILSVE